MRADKGVKEMTEADGASETVSLTCIVCPLSCALTVTVSGAGEHRRIERVVGHTCRRGAEYALAEVTHPLRTLTSTVAIRGARVARLPVRTRGEIPRAAIARAMQEIARIAVKAPVKMGQVILPDIAGTGVDLIASCDLPAVGSE